jgi:hypothetical protein
MGLADTASRAAKFQLAFGTVSFSLADLMRPLALSTSVARFTGWVNRCNPEARLSTYQVLWQCAPDCLYSGHRIHPGVEMNPARSRARAMQPSGHEA